MPLGVRVRVPVGRRETIGVVVDYADQPSVSPAALKAVHQVIDTAVYQNGRVLLRKSFGYAEFKRSSEFTQEWLRERVEEHHRFVIEDLRAGLLDDELSAAKEAAVSSGIEIELLNPNGWLSEGNVSLEVRVLRKPGREPEAGARVEAEIDGAVNGVCHETVTDAQGRAKIRFALPALGKGELALVISATAAEERETIRFAMRSKARNPLASAAPEN